MIYFCKRCGYSTNRMSSLRTHLIKKKCCDAVYSDVERASLLKDLNTHEGRQKANHFAVENFIPCKEFTDPSNYIQKLQKDMLHLQNERDQLILHIQKEKEKEQLLSKVNIEKEYNRTINKCSKCEQTFDTVNDLETHMRIECEQALQFDNVYLYNKATFASNMYKGNQYAGDIYIAQTDFTENTYKIGMTTNIPRRMVQYRTGAVREPRLHCYYPFSNISRADKDLKIMLQNFQLKREIYAGDLNLIKSIIRGYQLQMDGCLAEFTPRLA